jgi:hypothetical protein
MQMIKFSLILLAIITFSQCASAKFDNNPPFQITSAEVQTYSDGKSKFQGKSLTIRYTSKQNIQFDSVFFDKRSTNLQPKNTTESKMLIGYFTHKEKRDVILHENPAMELQNEIPIIKELSFQLEEHEAVISYFIKGKKKYLKITSIKKE